MSSVLQTLLGELPSPMLQLLIGGVENGALAFVRPLQVEIDEDFLPIIIATEGALVRAILKVGLDVHVAIPGADPLGAEDALDVWVIGCVVVSGKLRSSQFASCSAAGGLRRWSRCFGLGWRRRRRRQRKGHTPTPRILRRFWGRLRSPAQTLLALVEIENESVEVPFSVLWQMSWGTGLRLMLRLRGQGATSAQGRLQRRKLRGRRCLRRRCEGCQEGRRGSGNGHWQRHGRGGRGVRRAGFP